MSLSQPATPRGASVWQDGLVTTKANGLKETAMKNVYPRLYPSLFLGLILLKGYLVVTL